VGVPIFGNLGINVSKLINDNVGPSMLVAVLTVQTPGTRTAGQLTGGTQPTSATYTGRGMVEGKDRKYENGVMTETGLLKVLLIGDSFAVAPEVGNLITIESVTYRIVSLDRDPAAATYTCKVAVA
jgi:hypothetical protein